MARTRSDRSAKDRTCRFRQTEGDGFRLALEVTRRCDLSCVHCFVPREREQPTARDIIATIRQAGELGCQKLILTGGEPLLRRDLERIAAAAAERDILVDLNSNLFSLTRQRAKALRTAGVQEASVSLYGNRRKHDELTNRSGAFDRVLEGMTVLRETGFSIDAHGAIWDDMLPCLEELAETVHRHGASSLTFFSLLPTKRWRGGRGYRLDPENALAAVNRARASSRIPIRTVGLGPPERGECLMARSLFGLDAGLRLRPCLLSRGPGGGIDLRARGLREAMALLDTQVKGGHWLLTCRPWAEGRADG